MKLKPIDAAPKDGTYVIVFGDSGYTNIRFRAEICRYDAEFRPQSPWVNHSNSCFEDSGPAPIYWCSIPEFIPELFDFSELHEAATELAKLTSPDNQRIDSVEWHKAVSKLWMTIVHMSRGN